MKRPVSPDEFSSSHQKQNTMCGIYGVVGREQMDGLRDAAQTLAHRGPDAFGEWVAPDASVYLAHCRLSIVDLSEAGRQPMANEDGRVQVVFNGEIYNFGELRAELQQLGHQFRSRTDTEVIVHAYEEWGTACVERFRGIFAFGLWDGIRRQLILARDRLGVKPLFYSLNGQQLVFASEPRAILATPGMKRSMYVPAAIQYLQYTYTTGPTTIWDGVFRLAAAHVLVYDERRATITRSPYWSLPSENQNWSLDEAAERVDELLSDSVREELMGDVPVGVFLSGGVDSSLISAYASQATPSINSFCVDFVGWDGSELADSQCVARHLNTTHHSCALDRAAAGFQDQQLRQDFFKAWDEPIGDPAILPTWHVSRTTRQHVTVALSGDGGDELFAGYNWYRNVQSSPRREAAWFVERLRRRIGMGRSWPHGCGNQLEYYQLLHCATFSQVELCSLFPDWSTDIGESGPGQMFEPWSKTDVPGGRRWQIVDLHTYLIDNNLTRVDRASMAHGLEVRVPLLDHRLVEFAFSLPEECCSKNGASKVVLRELMHRRLPESTRAKQKQGFSFPLDRYISMTEMWKSLQNGRLVDRGILDATALARWKNETETSNLQMKLWLLFVFEQWARLWLFEE